MARSSCGCPVDGDIVMHGHDGPCAYREQAPTIEDYCGSGDNPHAYEGDDGEVGRCYCGQVTYPKGGPV